eukprot:jgi/Tetstr1/454040/TSEL_040959.t1
MDASIPESIRAAEDRSACCLLECDGPAHLDDRIAATARTGRAMLVVRSYSAAVRAKELGCPAVTGFESALSAMTGWATGVRVVSDRSVRFAARLAPLPLDLVVLEGVECLRLPNCPPLPASTVWMTKLTARRMTNRGWAHACYSEAIDNGAVIRRRGGNGRNRCPRPSWPAAVRPEPRDLYFDVRGDEAEVCRRAAAAGDTELMIRAFPGQFLEAAGDDDGARTGECPICYERPAPRVTARCCRRDFCLSCAARCMGEAGRCPWCRQVSGLWNCALEPGHRPAPFRDELLTDIVRTSLLAGPAARVLVVTTDDGYIHRVAFNPLRAFDPHVIGGSAHAAEAALRAFTWGADGARRVAVVHAERMFGCGLKFPASHVVFAEKDAWSDDRLAFWMAACPGASVLRKMVAITETAAP